MKYRIYFSGGNMIEVSENTFENLDEGLKLHDPKFFMINYKNIDYVEKYEETETQSTIIKPPTPAEIKAQEERNKEADDITLEGQLSKL